MTSARLILRGTFAQTILLVSAALLVAQGFGYFLLVNERDRWRLLDAVQPAVAHFVTDANEAAKASSKHRMETIFRLNHPDERLMLGPTSLISFLKLKRQNDLEAKLASALEKAGLHLRAVEASSIGFSNSPQQKSVVPVPPMRWRNGSTPQMPGPGQIPGPGQMGVPGGMPFPPGGAFDPRYAPGPPRTPSRPSGLQEIDFSVQLRDGTWLNGQFMSNRPSAPFIGRLVLAELILFAIVLTVALVLAMRLSRPMMRLATAADNLAPNQPPAPVTESGPSDIRAAIRSFNAMTRRVNDLLREKDRMIGAIGHDLRTPLASLRIRAESVESETEREKMIETIDDMRRMIDEILDFARLNYSREDFSAVDVAALVDSIVEEFREMGKDVTLLDSPRTVLQIQPFLMRRLLRNLIENGIKFGDHVHVAVEQQDDTVSIVVMDDGPGISQDALKSVLEPFARLEASRNKNTGGVGLGLSIAAGIARNQGAELLLENRAGGGLTARVRWTASKKVGRLEH